MEGGNLVGASHGPDDSVHGAEDVSKVVAMMCAVGEVVEFKNSFSAFLDEFESYPRSCGGA